MNHYIGSPFSFEQNVKECHKCGILCHKDGMLTTHKDSTVPLYFCKYALKCRAAFLSHIGSLLPAEVEVSNMIK